MSTSLRILSSKADSNTWESFTRSELKLESVHQESPRSDIFRKRATKTLLNQKHRQKHLTWEKQNWTVAQCSKVLFSDESKCLHSECLSTVFSEVYSQCRHLPGDFRALHASFCWQALWRCWFHFPAGLGTCTHCQRYQKLVQWPRCYCAWLAWSEHRESVMYCQEEDERHLTQQCIWPEGHYQSILSFITPEQCHRLIVSMPRRIDAVIHAKGGPTKYWVHRNEHSFQKPDISV